MSDVIYELIEIGTVELCWPQEDAPEFREVRHPGDDISDLPDKVQTAIAAHWTAERVAAWQAITGLA